MRLDIILRDKILHVRYSDDILQKIFAFLIQDGGEST